jgi:hypothetical protein
MSSWVNLPVHTVLAYEAAAVAVICLMAWLLTRGK